MTDDQRTQPYGRRATDKPSDDLYVRRAELSAIIERAVRKTLDEYDHECIMHLKADENEHMRDLVGAIREVGDGDLRKGIVAVRDNHKFVMQCHKAASRIGWGVIITIAVVLGSLGFISFSILQAKGGPLS